MNINLTKPSVQEQNFQGTYQEQQPCPNCGRCPCCGRGGYHTQPYPNYPYPYIGDSNPNPYISPNPWGGPYYGTTTITCGLNGLQSYN